MISFALVTGFLLTADNQKIFYNHYKSGHDKVIIIAHGFFNNKDTLLFKELSEGIARDYDVITFDFRGHGKSSGLFAWTTREENDLTRVIQYAKEENYKKIGVIGFSLGAAVSLINAGKEKNIDSLISVSAPTDFWKINYHFWEPDMIKDLRLNIGKKGIGKGVRPGNPFRKKIRPIDIVSKISPLPVLFIHGKKDWLIKPQHSEELYEKAKRPRKLILLASAGHAERIFDEYPDEFLRLCRDWFQKTFKKDMEGLCEKQ
ncbi:MAG: alpha/beta fold hydrolase [Candidatus Omnitrophica bacterium]|nr:alpha/beta fold hydrolase [Candidatus Omnitrophota bacterium]